MKEKLVLNANLLRKESEFITRPCVVEKAVAVSHTDFERLVSKPMKDNSHIANNVNLMYCDKDEKYHCLLVYDEEQGDGLLIESEGASYARYAQYVPKAKELVEGHQQPETLLTYSEKKRHNHISEMADRIAVFAHHSHWDFTIDDVMKDIGCDFEYVKSLIVEAVAEMLNKRNDISSVRVNNLGIPLQSEITVEAAEENYQYEDIYEEPENTM